MNPSDTENGSGAISTPVPNAPKTGNAPVEPIAEIPDVDVVYKPPVWSEEQVSRVMLLFVSLGLFGMTILLSFIVVATGSDQTWERTSDLLGTIIPVETLIIGAAVSYYFKSASSE